jgi:hypothetical protein
VSRRDIAAVFPRVIAQTERPILRTAPAPLYLLVRDSGIKVVLTGEGADERRRRTRTAGSFDGSGSVACSTTTVGRRRERPRQSSGT